MTRPDLEPPSAVPAHKGEPKPEDLIAEALKAGALEPADLVHHGVVVDQVGRSHAVYRFSVGGVPRFYVKTFGQSRGATDGQAAREHLVLSLAQDRPAVAAIVAKEWPWRGALAAQVVATEAAAGQEGWTFDKPGGGALAIDTAWAVLVAALAPALAAFHLATRDLGRLGAYVPPAIAPHQPWGLCLMDGDAAPELWAAPATAALLREAALDAELVAGLRAARAMWRPMALIHADLKHDNILLDTRAAGDQLTILDWEMARLGDPAWDLAGICARLAAARDIGPPWADADLDMVALLVSSYASESRLPAPALARRVMHYAGVVLLMMALQHGSTQAAAMDMSGAHTLVMKSRATFRRAEELTLGVLARVAQDR